MKLLTILLPFMILFSACSKHVRNHVYSSSDSTVNFKNYKTYAWVANTFHKDSITEDDEIIDWNIKNTLSSEFKKRNISLNIQNPDFVLDYFIDQENQIAIKKKKNIIKNHHPHNVQFNPQGHNEANYLNYKKRSVVKYEEIGIIIFMIDRKTNKEIWRGELVGKVKDEYDFENSLENDLLEIMKKHPIIPLN
jgi:hypothetical protein